MGVLETLASLVDAIGPDEVNIAFGGDVNDIDEVREDAEVSIKSGSADEKVVVSRDVVAIYPGQLQGEEYAAFLQLVSEAKQEEGSLTRTSELEATRSLSAIDHDRIDETCEFFESVLTTRQLSLLRSALFLREVSESERYDLDGSINRNKADLQQKYGYEAYYVCPLASSGYYDRDRYFRSLYHQVEEDSGPTDERFRDEYERIIGETLIATFVNATDSPEDVFVDVRTGLVKFFRHHPRADFFDICGLGSSCGDTIDEAVELLTNEYESLAYEDRDRGEERVVRLSPYSLKDEHGILGA